MSYWIKSKRTIQAQNRSKNYGVGIGQIQVSTRVKVRRKDVPLADNPPKAFKKACEKAGIPPTKRQLSKWNNNRGAARKAA